jgi:hypothetical protein
MTSDRPSWRSRDSFNTTARPTVQIWLLELVTLPATLDWDELDQQKFVCLCAIDASSISSDALSGFCSQLVDRGCAYFCAWGPDCERLHDIMDRRVIGDNPPETYIGCLMTTWHARESLAEAVDFFLTCTVPDDEYAPEGCPFGLAVVIGSPDWRPRCSNMLGEGSLRNSSRRD